MASNNFWTTPTYAPMQQFRYDVQTILFKADFNTVFDGGRVLVQSPALKGSTIGKELVKAINLPDVALGYDNDAANIGSGGPSIEAQDPQMGELELQLYMTPQLMGDIQDIFRTYYLQDIIKPGLSPAGTYRGRPNIKILNKDRVSLIPSPIFTKESQIIVNIYSSTSDPRDTKRVTSSTSANAVQPTPLKKIVYYGVYPISYNLGNLDYSSSDVVIGNMKFYFYGVEIRDGEDNLETSSQMKTDILSSIGRNGKKDMGNF